MTPNTSAMTPVEIDTELARIWEQLDRANLSKWQYEKRLRDAQTGRDSFYASAHRQAELAERIAKEQAKVDALEIEAAPYEAEFKARGGWQRYFLVKNNNGHVHRGTNCSTCYWNTQYAWLINLADCDEAAMIEEWGETACTVCFPDAPANPLYHRPSRRDREAQAAKEAEKAARAAERAAKAAQKAEARAQGTVKLSATEKRSAAIEALCAAYYGPDHQAYDFDAALPLAQALLALGKTDRWQSAAKGVTRAIEQRDQHWVTQNIIYLSHANG